MYGEFFFNFNHHALIFMTNGDRNDKKKWPFSIDAIENYAMHASWAKQLYM